MFMERTFGLYTYIYNNNDHCDGEQYGLHCAEHGLVFKCVCRKLKKVLADDAAEHRAGGKGGAGLQVKLNVVVAAADERRYGHGKHRAAGTEAERFDGHNAEHIEHRLYYNAAACAHDGAYGGRQQRNE